MTPAHTHSIQALGEIEATKVPQVWEVLLHQFCHLLHKQDTARLAQVRLRLYTHRQGREGGDEREGGRKGGREEEEGEGREEGEKR